MTPGIELLLAGNWKMNGLRGALGEIRSLAAELSSSPSDGIEVLVCPPATLLREAAALCEGGPLRIGGQDCHSAPSGAFTGDLSAAMIADAGASHVIVGHSERRVLHKEDDALIRAKAEAAHSAGLVAIVCVGETEAERRSGTTLDVLKRQLAGSVPDGVRAADTVIAYEPVWAIGTGLTPTPEDVEEAHAFMRGQLHARFGTEGEAMRILYGGSVKPSNAEELLAIRNVDGALVGGASLSAKDFLAIAERAKSVAMPR